jgi:putative transposase
MEQTAGAVRFIWSSALALQKYRLNKRLRILNYGELCRELTAARNDPELNFLSEIHSKPQQQVLKDLGKAFKQFFSGEKGFPRFKKKGRGDVGFRFPAYQDNIEIDGNRIKFPALGWIRFRKSREIEGVIKNVTIKRRGQHWLISVQTEREVADPEHPSSSEVGIDMGVAKFAALSTGEPVHPINSFRRIEQKMRIAQRSLSRKEKFSSNWKKQKAAISRLHIRIADARNDFLHKVSTSISKSHAVVYVEDLKVKNMSASARGTLQEPGKVVRRKSGLNKAILDQGWYEFRRQLTYKEEWRGGRVVSVPPQYTSQTCSRCGHACAENRRSQSEFVCVVCGHEEDADINAAKNIMRAGQALSVCGGGPLGNLRHSCRRGCQRSVELHRGGGSQDCLQQINSLSLQPSRCYSSLSYEFTMILQALYGLPYQSKQFLV